MTPRSRSPVANWAPTSNRGRFGARTATVRADVFAVTAPLTVRLVTARLPAASAYQLPQGECHTVPATMCWPKRLHSAVDRTRDTGRAFAPSAATRSVTLT